MERVGPVIVLPALPMAATGIFFYVYVLSEELDLEIGASKEELKSAMRYHILARGTLMGYHAKG